MEVAKSVTTASGYNYFGCKVCNVRGIPYTSTTLTVHLQTRSHKIMKELYECGLWPGPAEKYDYPERRIAIYKFLDTRGTLLCEACNKVMPDSMSLFKHQQSEEHKKILKDKNIEIPMIYMCEICEIFLTGLDNYYNHCWSVEHHEVTAVQQMIDCCPDNKMLLSREGCFSIFYLDGRKLKEEKRKNQKRNLR